MDERDPVEDGEFVYRRIHQNAVDLQAQTAIQIPSFRPNQNDVSGLSVFRAAFVQPAETLSRIDPNRAKEYYVVRLSVRDLRNLGLTVIPDPDSAGPLGHALIPELSWKTYIADKLRWKPILVQLAKLASAAIVHCPEGP
jgi:hypothetical protein